MNTAQHHASLALLILFALILACAEGRPDDNVSSTPELSQAQPYEVVKREDTSFPGRRRGTLAITSQATTYEAFAHTAIKAALQEQEKQNLEAATVWLIPHPDLVGLGFRYAQADYAPDGGGFSGDQDWTWKVEAADTAWTEEQLTHTLLWEARKEAYRDDRGLVDEDALGQALAEELGIHPDSLNLPFLWMKAYAVTD